MKYEVYNDETGEVLTRRTSRAVAQDDCEIIRWMRPGPWYVREVMP